jgi:hypothetical protein
MAAPVDVGGLHFFTVAPREALDQATVLNRCVKPYNMTHEKIQIR